MIEKKNMQNLLDISQITKCLHTIITTYIGDVLCQLPNGEVISVTEEEFMCGAYGTRRAESVYLLTFNIPHNFRFNYYPNLHSVYGVPIIKGSLKHLFAMSSVLKVPDINKWDMSRVIGMRGMFYKSKFNGYISQWNTSQVTDMSEMFRESEFNGDISQWDTSQVTHMCGMFDMSNFNGDISQWNTGQVTSTEGMFCGSKFDKDISHWDTGQVTDMRWMFGGSKFNGDISKWNTSQVTHVDGMFYGSKFNGYISQWNTSQVTDMCWVFFRGKKFNRDICQFFREFHNMLSDTDLV
jgi:surface protein